MTYRIFLFMFVSFCFGHQNQAQTVFSPDSSISLTFLLEKGRPFYKVDFHNQPILLESRLGLQLKGDKSSAENFSLIRSSITSRDTTWETVWGEEQFIRNYYNQLRVSLLCTTSQPLKMDIIFRIYNDGLAFRYFIPQQSRPDSIIIQDELSEFNLAEDFSCWWIKAYQGNRYEYLWQNTAVSQIDTVHTPFTMTNGKHIFLSIHEAALTDYASMTLARKEGTRLECDLVPWWDGIKVRSTAPLYSPWRTIQIAESAGELVESHLILNLNEPNRIIETDWIRPGKYVGVWWGMHIGKQSWHSGPHHGATTDTVKKYIDFAADHGFSGVLVEGWNMGWDGNWFDGGTDFKFSTPHPDFNIKELTAYARNKGIQIIGHHETGAGILNYEKQLDSAFQYAQSHGIHTIKTGYVGHGQNIIHFSKNGDTLREWHHGQFMVRHYRKVLETAAKYKIMLDVHEPIKATGIRRTWPNMMTREGARGMEYNAWSPDGGNPPDYATILPFTRLLAGPFDYTPGIFDLYLQHRKPYNRVNTTIVKQLAYYVTIYSPLQMAADLPENYDGHPLLKFIENVPTDWKTTKVLNARIGDFYTVVRQDRHSGNWYLGSITDENPREFTINLHFLEPGKSYTATIYRDGNDAHWKTNPLSYQIETKKVTADDQLNIKLAPGGGQAICFKELQIEPMK